MLYNLGINIKIGGVVYPENARKKKNDAVSS